MTGKGVGAISSIQVVGDSAGTILEKIFRPTGPKGAVFEVGKILIGDIVDGRQMVDQVVIGCEGVNDFAINCHGNPLIIADVMKLLVQEGVRAVSPEQLLTYTLAREKNRNAIELEAEIAQIKAATFPGAKIIANQIADGLAKTSSQWLAAIESISIAELARQVRQVLDNSKKAGLIINGCKVAIAGPPNSGKSTLLNSLCGRQKSIVTEIEGTTRDWVAARCRIESLSMELFDTAGLGGRLVSKSAIDKAAQEKSLEIFTESDLVLLVLDGSKAIKDSRIEITDGFGKSHTILVVFNKSDSGKILNENDLQFDFADSVRISAKFGEGIEELIGRIRDVLGVTDFDLTAPVCFTARQEGLLKQLVSVKSRKQAVSILTELLKGPIEIS